MTAGTTGAVRMAPYEWRRTNGSGERREVSDQVYSAAHPVRLAGREPVTA
ncbi:hypothetical protein ACWF95_14065 [Streptomyces vinaceus]